MVRVFELGCKHFLMILVIHKQAFQIKLWVVVFFRMNGLKNSLMPTCKSYRE